jgi:hypothetical protein
MKNWLPIIERLAYLALVAYILAVLVKIIAEGIISAIRITKDMED